MNDLKDKQVQTAIYSMMAISGLSVLLRFFLQWLRKEPLRAEDGFMLFAFVGFFVLATIFIISLPAAYRIIAVGNNELAEYDGLYGDEVLELKVSFASNIIFPMVLWSVKLSLLSISHRVLDRQFQWLRAWWVIVGFVILTYIGCFVLTFTSCVTISDYFTPGACSSDRDNRAQVANLYYVVVAEILTDILIMALPITFVHRVTFLDRKLLIRTMGIFSVGIVCIIIALCRGITIGISESWGTPTFPWIVLWEMIEGGITVLVGCLPTYARYYIQARKPHARVRTVTTSSAAAFEHRHILSGSDDAVDYQAAITANRPMPTKVERVKNSIRRATTSKNRESGGSIMAGGIFASTNIFHTVEKSQSLPV